MTLSSALADGGMILTIVLLFTFIVLFIIEL